MRVYEGDPFASDVATCAHSVMVAGSDGAAAHLLSELRARRFRDVDLSVMVEWLLAEMQHHKDLFLHFLTSGDLSVRRRWLGL